MDNIYSKTLYEDVSQYRNSHKTAIFFRRRAITYEVLLRRIDHMAEQLTQIGIQRDTVVTLLSPNVPETIVAFYALNKIGAIVSILHPLLPVRAFHDAISETKTSFVLMFSLRYQDYQEELKPLENHLYFLSADPDLNFWEKIAIKKKYRSQLSLIPKAKVLSSVKGKPSASLLNACVDAYKPSVYLRSGGTTGKSKTIILNDAALRFPGSQAQYILNRELKGFSMIGVLPLFHGFGLAMGVHAPLMHEASVALMMNFDPKETVWAIKHNQVNLLITVPYMAEKLLHAKGFISSSCRNLYMTFIGADKPSEALINSFNSAMQKKKSLNRLYEGYGLTETVTVCCVNTPVFQKKGSVGKPLPGVFVRIVNPLNRNQEMPTGQDGEILITGPCNCLGYLNAEKRQQPFFTDQNHVTWVCSHDIGHVDQDGFVYFRNRSNDLIKIAGYNVFPSEIESYACEIEGVNDAAAIYVPGEHPYIHLYLESHQRESHELTEETRHHLLRCLIKYSMPEKITVLPRFPRTSVGKIDRKALIHY